MNIQAQIEILKSLAVLDAELATLDGELRTEQKELAGKKSLLSELDGRVRTGSSTLQEMDKTRGELVGEMRQMSIQIDRAREKLARCRNEREANAATRELEELRKLYRDREHEAERLVGLADEAKVDVEATSQRRDQVAGELGQSEGEKSERISVLEKDAAEKREARAELIKKMDQMLFRRYDRVRSQRGSGLAIAANGSCMACHISLPPMLFQQIMYNRGLHQCPQCHRVLYFSAPEAPPDSSENESSVNQAG